MGYCLRSGAFENVIATGKTTLALIDTTVRCETNTQENGQVVVQQSARHTYMIWSYNSHGIFASTFIGMAARVLPSQWRPISSGCCLLLF